MRPRPYRERTPYDIPFAIGGLLWFVVLEVVVPRPIFPFVLWGSVIVALFGSCMVMTRREVKRLQREREKTEGAHRDKKENAG